MKTLIKYTVTLLLIVAFTVPLGALAQGNPPPPPPDNQPKLLFLACAVLVVGAVVVWGLWKICKKLPALPPPNDGGTNAPPSPPPTRPPVTNPPPHRAVSPPVLPGMELMDVERYNIAEYHFVDQVMGGQYSSKSKWAVQAKTSLANTWQTTISVSVFDNDQTGGQLWAVYQNGSNIYNAYYLPGAQFNLPVDFALPDQGQQFFRLAGLVWINPLESF